MPASGVLYEMIMLIIMLLAGSTSLTSVVILIDQPIISYTNEKTALDSVDVENIIGKQGYGRDLLATLVNTDESNPYPNAIKIDGSPVMKLDTNFQTSKFKNISSMYDANGQYRLSIKLDKPIKAMLFEVVDGVDCMHYYIDNEPPT